MRTCEDGYTTTVAAILFLVAVIIAAVQGLDWHTFAEFVAIEFSLIAAGLLCLSLDWTGIPRIAIRRTP